MATNVTRTFDIVNGRPVPDVAHLDGPAALARKREVEARLGAIKGDLSKAGEREALKLENAALDKRLGELREQTKRENARATSRGSARPFTRRSSKVCRPTSSRRSSGPR